jgi:hypothetical protein
MLHVQVSQQVNYAKGMFEERRYTVISTGDSMLEDWTVQGSMILW